MAGCPAPLPPNSADLSSHTGWVEGVAWAPDGKTLATASADMTARIWDGATGRTLRTLTGHFSKVSGVAWAQDGKTLATASADKTARIWDAAPSTRPSTTPSVAVSLTRKGAPSQSS
jgi:WD40 repeat protein